MLQLRGSRRSRDTRWGMVLTETFYPRRLEACPLSLFGCGCVSSLLLVGITTGELLREALGYHGRFK